MTGRESGLRRLLLPGLLTLLCAAILIGLGTWQLQRLAWKEGLLETIAERTTAAPLELRRAEDFSALTPAADEYRRVRLRGTFRHQDEVQVYTLLGEPRGPYGGPGYWVLTPLDLADDGGTVIVNRGFVPPDRKDPASRASGQVVGEVTVTGLLRAPEVPNLFTPANDPSKGAWYNRDPADIAKALGLQRVAPFLIDADATSNPGGLPEGGETRLTFPNRHLEYALTWYGLAIGLVGVFIAWAFTRRRGVQSPEVEPALPAEPGQTETPGNASRHRAKAGCPPMAL